MRFLILTSVVAVGAAVIGATLPASYVDQIASTGRSVSSGAAKVIADPSELNPLRWIFDGVQHQVQTNDNHSSLFVGTPVTIQSLTDRRMSSGVEFVDPRTHTHNAMVAWHATPQ